MSLDGRVGLVLRVIAGVVTTLLLVTLAFGAYLYSLSSTLPDLEVNPDALKTPQTSIVYAADGSVLAEWHGEQDRTIVAFDEMPEHLRDAVVAIEDQRFYEHNGVDLEGIIRAARANAEAGEVRQGGSTITQQLVKLLFTEGERTLTRKIREALLAYELEARADKNKVLETYLNTVYFGNGAYGVEAASKRYFGKRTAALTPAESALLAGVIRSPSRFDPIKEPREALARRDLVLRQMREQGHLDAKTARDAEKTPVILARRSDVPAVAPFFVEYVRQELIKALGAKRVYEGGLRVQTTLEPELQRIADASAKQLSSKGDPEVALVALRHSDGSVVAMVGGRDFGKNQFNLAAQGKRQPGSAFKPFVLVAALENGVRPESVYSAAPYSVEVKDGIWKVENYENTFAKSALSLQAATSWSVNAVYARLIMDIGPEKVVQTAKKMGIVSRLDPDPAIALGGLKDGVSPMEMASAYGTVANGGLRVNPSGILKVTDDRGKIVLQPNRASKRVLDKRVAVETSLMLHDVVENGTGTAARIGVWAAGKTGTTQSYRDAWFVGWAGDISTAVWVGYPEAQVEMTEVHGIRVTGGSFPASIWAQFMKGATSARSEPVTPPTATEVPTQVVVRVCQESMKLANSRCPDAVDIYLTTDLVPTQVCPLH